MIQIYNKTLFSPHPNKNNKKINKIRHSCANSYLSSPFTSDVINITLFCNNFILFKIKMVYKKIIYKLLYSVLTVDDLIVYFYVYLVMLRTPDSRVKHAVYNICKFHYKIDLSIMNYRS